MEITGTIKEGLNKLSRVNIEFLEFVKKNPGGFNRWNFKPLELNDEFYRLQPWPTFISRPIKTLFQDAGVKVYNLIKSIPARLFDNDPVKISNYYEFPANLIKLQMEGVTHDHLANLLGRGDFIFSPTGVKCLEFNISVNVSGWQLPAWEALYLKTPVISRFLEEYQVKINNENFISLFLEHILGATLHQAGEDREINIAIVTGNRTLCEGKDNKNPLLMDFNRLYNEQLCHKSLKGSIFMCDYKHLEVVNQRIYLKGKRIHALVELFNGLVPPGIMKTFAAGNTCLFNGPVTGLLSNKLNLVLLSEYEDSDLFSHEEKDTIKKYIPWTRRITPGEMTYNGERVKTGDFIISNKDKFVVKSSLGLGGEGVWVGKSTPANQWETLVKTAVRKQSFLVQEWVECSPGLYQVGESGWARHDTVWGFWVFGSRYAGTWVRAMPQNINRGVISCHEGATISVIFEVED